MSRRTFFNYFASKDDAVLGLPLDRSDAAAIAHFLTSGEDGPGISSTLLTDLAVLAEERWQALDIAPDTVADLLRAVDKEPRLLGRMLEAGAESEKFDARLIEQRENLPAGRSARAGRRPDRRRASRARRPASSSSRATPTPSSRSSSAASSLRVTSSPRRPL